MIDSKALEYIERVPKVELHVHLEGAIRPARFLKILRRNGLHPELRSDRDLHWLFAHSSFAEFLDHYRFVTTCMRQVQDVHEVALDLFEDLQAQNIVYAEVIFATAIFCKMGLPWDELLAAVNEAARIVESAHKSAVGAPNAAGSPHAGVAPPTLTTSTRYNIVVDLVRNFGADHALEQVERLAQAAPDRVVGIHLGGDEKRFPAKDFGAAYHVAHEAGLGLAAHAGEGDGPQSVRDTLEILQVQRIGHGIRCVEDPPLLKDIRDRGVTLEICPTSNVCTRVVTDLKAHPLPLFLREGIKVTLASDDPAYFATHLTKEMTLVHQQMGVSLNAVDSMMDTGARAAFDKSLEVERFLESMNAERQVLRKELGIEFKGSP